MRVAVIGAGVIGCAAAIELAKRGAEVVLLERAVPGAEASNAAAGILAVATELDEADPERIARACAEYGPWSAELRRETGIDVGYRVTGTLFVAGNEEERGKLERLVAIERGRGGRAEMLDGAAARAIEPELARDTGVTAYFP
ncbi:MAG TPA: FAD-dependent oxidoreductase, partial [Polyangiaceae bacterium]|nr:FAD-dependent oxidoreductase [Polyangiaceae bacterium]